MNPYEIYFDGETQIHIRIDGRVVYEIDLSRCNTAAEILDWILQVKKQVWYKPFMADLLIEVFNTTCKETVGNTLQVTFCPCGKNIVFNWMDEFSKQLINDVFEEDD